MKSLKDLKYHCNFYHMVFYLMNQQGTKKTREVSRLSYHSVISYGNILLCCTLVCYDACVEGCNDTSIEGHDCF